MIWGEPGDNAQHSFFQLLHQGTQRAALDFLLPINSSCASQPQQDLAIASCLAQAEAFALGQDAASRCAPSSTRQKLSPRRDRGADAAQDPSKAAGRLSLLLFERLDPATLGRIIALYEHKVFVQSVVWGDNAFDQWGVELGKKLCETLHSAGPEARERARQSSSLAGRLGLCKKVAPN